MITIKRTYFRTLALILLFTVFCLAFRSTLQPISEFSILTLLSNEKVRKLLNPALIQEVGIFTLVLLVVHLVWAYIITVSCKVFFKRIENDSYKTLAWLNICSLHFLCVIAFNSYVSPTSLLGILRTSWLSSSAFNIFLISTVSALFLYNLYKYHSKRAVLIWTTAVVLACSPPLFITNENQHIVEQKPNVIIIGVDGLRPDHLTYRNFQHDLMPNLNNFLDNSVIYDKTYTVFPRTYVSWLSLLKSQYPISHGGRFNLTPDPLVSKDIPFLDTLKDEDYNTIWALDERRFNIIDESYGFDNVVGPKMGIADTLINTASDLPLVNVLINTRLGYYFLPYIHMNRAVGRTFSPESFNDAALEQLSPTQSNFLAIHFCMLHWPYTSKNFINVKEELWDGNHAHFMYKSLLPQVDAQFSDLMKKLKHSGYLDNAILYVMSDHGDSFNLKEDRMTTALAHVRPTSYGHGTNVLDQAQSEILLAYAEYKNGRNVTKPQVYKGLFSNLDIVPTIGSQLDLQIEGTQGVVLPSNNPSSYDSNFVFVESSLPMKTLNTSEIDAKSVISKSIDHYTVNDEGNLVLRNESYTDFLTKIHRSIYHQKWQLAHLPEFDEFVVVDLEQKHVSSIDDHADNEVILGMKEKFCEHYEEDIEVYFPAHCNK